MSRHHDDAAAWQRGLWSSGSLTPKLLGPLTAVVELAWPGEPAHLAYAARSTALRLLGDEEQVDRVGLAAHVCNIGMVGWLERLTSKPGTLSLEERRAMEQHPVLGAGMLEPWQELDPAMAEIALAVRHHHERWDGMGYPDGLSGEAIPLASRIIHVAEAHQAMLSPRPYRPALPVEVARQRLRRAAGSQFDPAAVEALIAWRESEPGSDAASGAACGGGA